MLRISCVCAVERLWGEEFGKKDEDLRAGQFVDFSHTFHEPDFIHCSDLIQHDLTRLAFEPHRHTGWVRGGRDGHRSALPCPLTQVPCGWGDRFLIREAVVSVAMHLREGLVPSGSRFDC